MRGLVSRLCRSRRFHRRQGLSPGHLAVGGRVRDGAGVNEVRISKGREEMGLVEDCEVEETHQLSLPRCLWSPLQQ